MAACRGRRARLPRAAPPAGLSLQLARTRTTAPPARHGPAPPRAADVRACRPAPRGRRARARPRSQARPRPAGGVAGGAEPAARAGAERVGGGAVQGGGGGAVRGGVPGPDPPWAARSRNRSDAVSLMVRGVDPSQVFVGHFYVPGEMSRQPLCPRLNRLLSLSRFRRSLRFREVKVLPGV